VRVLDLAIAVSDHPVAPDQYRFVETHAWWLGTFGPHQHLTEHVLRTWVPADPDREWLQHRSLTGAQTWLAGSARAAAEDGFELRSVAPTGVFRGWHGQFDTSGADDPLADLLDPDELFDEPVVPCAPPPRRRRGSWQDPTPEFFARLPRDAAALLAQLQEACPGRWFGPFTAAVTALRTGLVPADLRAPLYRALTGLPSVAVVEGVANLDGAACLALVHDAGRTRTELFVDPADGCFAGERDTLRVDSRCGLRAGTVISDTAVRTAVVDAAGAVPPP
jgi:hypothetical protein